MRKPRDYDAELKALSDKAASLKRRKVEQLGELVVATGADKLPIDLFAGVLLAALQTTDPATKEAWQRQGAAFFREAAGARRRARAGQPSAPSRERDNPPAPGQAGAA